MIVDAHVTLGSDRVIPPRFIAEQAANVHHRQTCHGQQASAARVLRRVRALYADHDGDRLVSEMDAAGVDMAYLVAADFSQVTDDVPTPADLAAHHHRVRTRHPGRFGVFWGVDPRTGPEGVELFERCVGDYGFAGLKVYPLNGFSPSDTRLYPYYEVCAAHGMPVLTHTGPGWAPLDFTFGDPLLVDRAARDFPTVPFILGHGGVTNVDVASYLCAHRPNVHLDISQFPAALSADGWQAHLNRLFRTGINHKILFGTCWPSFRLSTSLTALIEEFRDGTVVFAGVRDAERDLILRGNVNRLVGAPRHLVKETA